MKKKKKIHTRYMKQIREMTNQIAEKWSNVEHKSNNGFARLFTTYESIFRCLNFHSISRVCLSFAKVNRKKHHTKLPVQNWNQINPTNWKLFTNQMIASSLFKLKQLTENKLKNIRFIFFSGQTKNAFKFRLRQFLS